MSAGPQLQKEEITMTNAKKEPHILSTLTLAPKVADQFDNAVTRMAREQGAIEDPPSELQRLETGKILLTVAQLGQQLEAASKAYMDLPTRAPQQVEETLQQIIAACKFGAEKAQRLLAANR
jgi:hypothetical protein